MLFARKPEPKLDEVLTRVVELEATVRTLRLEWQETIDRVELILRRIAKRQKDLNASLTHELPPPPYLDTPPVDPITERIHARRGTRVRSIRQTG